MKLLTLFPPTFAVEGGQNGGNRLGYAYYRRDHPFSAAVFAQELREARMKLPYGIAGLIVGAGAGYAVLGLSPWIAVFALWGAFLCSIPTMLDGFRRRLEIRGQGVECVVRELYYGTELGTAIVEASRQLTRYSQFKGWSQERIAGELFNEQASARRWVKDNARLIEKALRLQATR